MTEALQFTSQFLMVVNFAVEYDGCVGVFGQDGLVTQTKIDDFQASRAHRKELRLEDTLLVRPAVNQGCSGLSNAIGVGNPTFSSKTDDSTHDLTPPTAELD
jgi:hypothetical protein